MDEFTDAEIAAFLLIDSGEARQHARCGPLSGCRQRALARVDEDLDLWLERNGRPAEPMALPSVRPTGTSPIPG